MNNEQTLENLAFNQLSLGTTTQFEANRQNASINMTPSSLPLVLQKWQPMGIRVIVDLPYTPPDGSPLFAIRVTPTWYTPIELASTMGVNAAADFSESFNSLPVFLPYTGANQEYKIAESTTDTPVRVSYYGDPPPICRYSRIHRYNSGSLKYQVVMTPGSVTHGYFQASVIRGVPKPYKVNRVFSLVPLNVYRPDFNSTYDNFVNIKPASEGFIEMNVPRVNATGRTDTALDMPGLFAEYDPNGYDYLMVYSKGTISSLSPTQMVFELNIAAGDDYKMHVPLPISSDLRNFWGRVDLALLGNGFSNTLLSHPEITYPSALQAVRQYFVNNGIKPTSRSKGRIVPRSFITINGSPATPARNKSGGSKDKDKSNKKE